MGGTILTMCSTSKPWDSAIYERVCVVGYGTRRTHVGGSWSDVQSAILVTAAHDVVDLLQNGRLLCLLILAAILHDI